MTLTLWLFLKKPYSPILTIVISILDVPMFSDLVECYLPVIAIRNTASGLVKGKSSQERSWVPVAIISLWLLAITILPVRQEKSHQYNRFWKPPLRCLLCSLNFGSHPYIVYYVLCSQFLHIFNLQATRTYWAAVNSVILHLHVSISLILQVPMNRLW